MCLMKESILPKHGDKKSDNNLQTNSDNHSSIKIKIPKLSRKIVKSAKVNLNRYWRAFHELISPETYQKTIYNNQILDKALEKNHLLNNEVAQLVPTDINDEFDAGFVPEKNVIYQNENNFLNGKYILFVDDNLYNGVDFNHEFVVYDKCPCTCHGADGQQQGKQLYTNRFSINVMENIHEMDLTPYWLA